MALLFWSRTLPETDVTVCGLSGPFTLTGWLALSDSPLIVAVTVTVTVLVPPALTVGAFSGTVKSFPSWPIAAIWLHTPWQSMPGTLMLAADGPPPLPPPLAGLTWELRVTAPARSPAAGGASEETGVRRGARQRAGGRAGLRPVGRRGQPPGGGGGDPADKNRQ